MKKHFNNTKSLGLFCLALTFIASIVFIANFSLVNAQNKTILQDAESGNNNNNTSGIWLSKFGGECDVGGEWSRK